MTIPPKAIPCRVCRVRPGDPCQAVERNSRSLQPGEFHHSRIDDAHRTAAIVGKANAA